MEKNTNNNSTSNSLVFGRWPQTKILRLTPQGAKSPDESEGVVGEEGGRLQDVQDERLDRLLGDLLAAQNGRKLKK